MTSLYHSLPTQLNVVEDSQDHIYAYTESLLYVAGAVSAFAYQRFVKKYCTSVSAKKYRLTLQGDRYTNLSLKLYMLRLVVEKIRREDRAKALAEQLSIKPADATVVWMLYKTNSWFRKEIVAAARSVSRTTETLCHNGVQRTFNRVFPSVHKYIKHIVYKKLRFLVKSTNTDFQDFQQDISAKVSQAFYSLVPVEHTDAYITNYLKRAAHNHAINIIKAETTQKRGRLVNVGVDRSNVQQFSLLCVSENQMAPILDSDGNALSPDAADESACTEKFELRFSIGEILDTVKKQTKKYRFLTLLLGAEDSAFTQWLRQNKLCTSTEDNVDVQARETSQAYTSYIANFLQVSKNKVETFFQKLRNQLAMA